MHRHAYPHICTHTTCAYITHMYTRINPVTTYIYTHTAHTHIPHTHIYHAHINSHLNANFKTRKLKKENKGKIFLRLEVKRSDIKSLVSDIQKHKGR